MHGFMRTIHGLIKYPNLVLFTKTKIIILPNEKRIISAAGKATDHAMDPEEGRYYGSVWQHHSINAVIKSSTTAMTLRRHQRRLVEGSSREIKAWELQEVMGVARSQGHK